MSGMPDSQHIRLGIIGFGSWAINAYLPAEARIAGAEVIAAAGRSDATREAARAALGREAFVTPDFHELLDPDVADAVMIAVTEDQHAAVIGAALDSGLPVFYEPPLSDRRSEIRGEIARLTLVSQVTHADLELSYLPVVDRAAAFIAEGAIGTPHTALVTMTSGWGPVPGSDISLALQLIPWYLDPLNRMIGRRPSRVLVQDGSGVPGRMQSQTLVQLDYDGIRGTFDANIESVGGLGAWIAVHGSDGDLEADLFRGELRFRSGGHPGWQTEPHPARQPHASWPGMHESVAAFIDAVNSGRGSHTGSATMADLQLTGLAAEDSIDSGTWATVEYLE
jgi:predicted dehydrogenase